MRTTLRITILGIVALAILGIMSGGAPRPATDSAPAPVAHATTSQTASAAGSAQNDADQAIAPITANSPATTSKKSSVSSAKIDTAKSAAPAASAPADSREPDRAYRIDEPYATPALSFATVNIAAREALVNILCAPHGGGLRPISASGVIIDTRGVILTNAHVAQYVLLSRHPAIDLSCVIRTGAPAYPTWTAQVLYIPPAWVEAHYTDISDPRPTGTGEHDYALLLVTGAVGNAQLPASFPFLSPDTREAVAFAGDPVLAAGYPAEYVGPIVAMNNLYPVSSVTGVRELLTFSANAVDLVSLGGVIEAQSGSSGGAVVNAWNRLVGVVTTTSEGGTTAERDLRAVTMSYIDRDLRAQTTHGLSDILSGDVYLEMQDFSAHAAPKLLQLYLDLLSKKAR